MRCNAGGRPGYGRVFRMNPFVSFTIKNDKMLKLEERERNIKWVSDERSVEFEP